MESEANITTQTGSTDQPQQAAVSIHNSNTTQPPVQTQVQQTHQQETQANIVGTQPKKVKEEIMACSCPGHNRNNYHCSSIDCKFVSEASI